MFNQIDEFLKLKELLDEKHGINSVGKHDGKFEVYISPIDCFVNLVNRFGLLCELEERNSEYYEYQISANVGKYRFYAFVSKGEFENYKTMRDGVEIQLKDNIKVVK